MWVFNTEIKPNMRRQIKYMLGLFAMLSVVSCETQLQQEVADVELKISRYIIGMYGNGQENPPLSRASIDILQGNGEYRIIYPKEIFCDYWGTVSPNHDEGDGIYYDDRMKEYSEDIVKVWIEGERIEVEQVIPAYSPDGFGERNVIIGYFLVEDGKDKRRLFKVESVPTIGGVEVLWEDEEASMIANESYWQNM
jgi:hypothetical protein